MRLSPRVTGHRLRLHPQRRTIRMRLTLIYWGLFVVSGAALLAITIALFQSRKAVAHLSHPGNLTFPQTLAQQHTSPVHELLIVSGIALAVTAVPAVALGWLVAGRLLRPLRTITTTTRRISATNLDERLNLAGPDDELKELGDTFDDLLARLDRSFQFERRFVANASHELRTPLTTMRASLDVATTKPGPVHPQTIALADRLRRELDRVDRLLESFLALAHAQHAPVTDESTLSLGAIASAAIERRAGAISHMELDVDQEASPEVWVRGSETLLSRMVENVIDNAVKHNEPGGWVRVKTAIDGGLARLVVENGGPALAQGDVEELAQPFRRLGAERTGSDRGSGLGLSIVQSIAQVHDGKLELHALSEGGLRVIIALPLAVGTVPGAQT
jgi:signal transduction histidine kinase